MRNILCSAALYSVFCLSGLCLSGPASADSSSGIDTPAGVTSLPLSVEGTTVMTLTNAGVGIGSEKPKMGLDVNGYIRAGSATKGSGCAYEGMTAYDYSAHEALLCNSSKIWASLASAPSGTWCGMFVRDISMGGGDANSPTESNENRATCQGVALFNIAHYTFNNCPSGYTMKSFGLSASPNGILVVTCVKN